MALRRGDHHGDTPIQELEIEFKENVHNNLRCLLLLSQGKDSDEQLSAYPSLTAHCAVKYFDRWALSSLEHVAHVMTIQLSAFFLQETEQRAHAAFDAFDTDSSGNIDMAELSSAGNTFATTGGHFDMPMTIIGAGGTAPNQSLGAEVS